LAAEARDLVAPWVLTIFVVAPLAALGPLLLG
jgi:hypothetical protein